MPQNYVQELIEYKEELDVIAHKLFELDPAQERQPIPREVLFALGGIIVYIRTRVV